MTGEKGAAVAGIHRQSVTVGQIMSQPAVAVAAQQTAWVAVQRSTTSSSRSGR
jgi:hypothetical protein